MMWLRSSVLLFCCVLLIFPSSQAVCIQGAIRLQGGSSRQGRVEVCNRNIWGTVCDDAWGTIDARVACRQLGFSTSGSAALTFGYTNGVGQIWLDNVSCRGTESRLIDCRSNGLGRHDCGHSEDAGVRCLGTASMCTQGAIRLQGGTATTGRVEICNSNVWGTVCDDLWGSTDAQVACRQLGFADSGAVALTTGFTNGAGQTWLSNLRCLGSETRLIDCTHSGLGVHSCSSSHFEDAGVRCNIIPCTQGAIRLQGGTATQGRVEICNNNIWGTVCDNAWGNPDAEVACRQLGLNSTGAAALSSGFTAGTGQIWLDSVTCLGTETRLIDCTASPLGTHSCVHTDDAGVRCEEIETDSNCTEQGAIRLQGFNAIQGRVEICNDDIWGTICDDFWGTADASVACRQLGFEENSGAVALTSGFTNGVGQIWLSSIQCRGSETNLTDCTHANFGEHSCSHSEEAGVRCSTCTTAAIRLQGGNATQGRVEICNNNVWGTVCDDGWSTANAQVACRQLGFEATGAVALATGFTSGEGQIWLSNVQCRGSETRLIDCTNSGLGVHSCTHIEDAGVRCPTCTQGAIRLQGGTANSGRVEICNDNIWGTVCDNLWDSVDAQVACRQLGFQATGAYALTSGFTNGAGQIWLENVQCSGGETRLVDCIRPSFGAVRTCTHIEDAGVRCPPCTQGDIRLQGGNTTTGRVEICNNNAWGTVCDDFWDAADAQVACRQMGFEETGAVALTSGFINGAGQIWLSDVQCGGTETRLMDCIHPAFGTHSCLHNQDAGVSCSPCSPQGAIRLQGGNSFSGRVEVCDNIWGTVCDNLWSNTDAQVACRQLGFEESAGAAAIISGFTNGVGQIWLDNVQCDGTETRLLDCPARPLGTHSCSHIEDAGVRCLTCIQGAIRLQGGTATTGRVEICNNNVWGTVCDNLWDTSDAQVACRQLGFEETGAVALTSGFNNGDGQIWLSNIQCGGTETRLVDCTHTAYGTHSCSHNQDAGVRCLPCSPQGAIRLQGGTATQGRVEICNGVWGTVCDDLWNAADAQVTCKQLGFEAAGATSRTSGFLNGAGQVWLSNVQCSGDESRLVDCPASPLGSQNCSHIEDAGVRCLTCITGAIRLRGGNATAGRVEICNNAVWGTVCNDLWGTTDVQVACRQLGFESTGAVALTSGFTGGSGQIWLSNVQCYGTEARLIDCAHPAFGVHSCSHVDDAGVRCLPCTQGAIRLQGGTATQGRVEICNNNVWGTVCDDLWGTYDAQVACRQLGFKATGAVALTYGFTNGAGPIWLSNVQCLRTESKLIDCTHSTFHSCSHFEDAGVRCLPCTRGDVRLQGGNATQGRVEICNNNVWGTVCDDLWDTNDAQVACRQLGFEATGAVALTSGFTNGAGQIWLSNTQCSGSETRLIDCTHPALGVRSCSHAKDAGVSCLPCTQGAIRLQGGTATTGRVEICNSNIWGTVCDDLWGTTDARVACRQLGFQKTGAVALTIGFTNGAGQTWLSNLRCLGSETRLVDCTHSGLGVHSCSSSHIEDAGVRCLACAQGDVRLQGGNATSGRVEVCNANTWGTVCDDTWDILDAQVVCRQLGFSTTGAQPLTLESVPNGSGVIWLDNVNCRGTEARLIDCLASSLGSHDCGHSEDAGVGCLKITCTQGAIRLQGGTATQGRVEVCNNNVWGTVCDDFWGTYDAQVACRQLGFLTTGAVALTSGFTDGVGQIWLDNVQCRGFESRLIDCRANPLGIHGCSHYEDAGVRCRQTCTQGAIRLQGGTATTGRVEICNNNVWGTVCDDLWDNVDAQVACRQLGFEGAGSTAITTGFTNGAGQTWLSNVRCLGSETRLIDCTHSGLGVHRCSSSHVEDAGVRCIPCTQGAIRLQGGNATQGRVEICNNNIWGTVCNDEWSTADAQVACRQLGFKATGAVALTTGFSNGAGQIWLSDVECLGTEPTLTDCTHSNLHRCSHLDDAGVRCIPCTQGDIILQGGNATSGRVEVCNAANIWGTVCDDTWDILDAQVVCRQLGFSTTGAQPLTLEDVPDGSGVILRGIVNCQGIESRLIDCFTSVGSQSCNHSEDVGVRCLQSSCTQGDIRLQGGNATQGRVEICNSNVWGTVCDDLWGIEDAQVACRQLGFSAKGATSIGSGFIHGIGQVWLDNVDCRGTETRLIDCPASPLGRHNCAHFEDVGVNCVTVDCMQDNVMVPTISTIVWSSPTTLNFEVSSINPSATFRIYYYNKPGTEFDLNDLVRTFQTNQSSVRIEDLRPCLSYWVVVTSVLAGCENQPSSSPQVINPFESIKFKFAISLENDPPCSVWITDNYDTKIADIETAISLELQASSCGVSVPCMANSQFTCEGRMVYYETVLSSTESLSSQQQLDCLNKWLSSEANININGIPAKIRASNATSTDSSTPASNSSDILWPILAVALAIAVLTTGAILIVVIFFKYKKQPVTSMSNVYGFGNVTNSNSSEFFAQPSTDDDLLSLDQKPTLKKEMEGTAVTFIDSIAMSIL